jgi:hypothetical protein
MRNDAVIPGLRAFALLVVSSLAVGCGAGPKVPSGYAGDVPVTISNHHSATICTFVMLRPDDSKIVNWLGSGSKRAKIPTGGTHEFHVQPGTYAVAAAGCNDGENWAAANKRLRVTGPTRLSVGGPEAPIPGTAVVVLPVRSIDVQYADGPEEAPPAEAPTEKKNCVPEGGHTTDSRNCCSPLSTGFSPNVTCK